MHAPLAWHWALPYSPDAVNLFLFVMGRLHTGKPAVLSDAASYTDPVPQALVLTAIVIGFAMTAFVLILALRANTELGQ